MCDIQGYIWCGREESHWTYESGEAVRSRRHQQMVGQNRHYRFVHYSWQQQNSLRNMFVYIYTNVIYDIVLCSVFVTNMYFMYFSFFSFLLTVLCLFSFFFHLPNPSWFSTLTFSALLLFYVILEFIVYSTFHPILLNLLSSHFH